MLSVYNCLFTGKKPPPHSRTPPCRSNLTLMLKVKKYTNSCWGLFCQLFKGKNNKISALKYNLCGQSLRTLHYKRVPQQVIGDTNDDCSTRQEESTQLHGTMPLGKDGPQSPQSGLEEWQRESDKALLLCLVAQELILSPPLTHCPSVLPLQTKYVQPTTAT